MDVKGYKFIGNALFELHSLNRSRSRTYISNLQKPPYLKMLTKIKISNKP